jgi:hypothetical protein
MIKTKFKQRYYDIPRDDLIPMVVTVRTILETPDEEVPADVIKDVIYRISRLKCEPRFIN